MIRCRPKFTTYLSLTFIVVLLIAGLAYLLSDFHRGASYGLVFYLFACTIITVVLLLLLVKMMAGFKFIIAGKSEIVVSLPLRRMKRTYGLNQVMGWQEEKLTANKREFKQLSLLFEDKYSISVSNHEHLEYDALFNYLKKRIPKKKLKE
jgi:apolipoprotein N-acyltransferase